MRTLTLALLRRADGPDLPLLQHAEELALQGQRHLRHLVEEERAAVGDLEEPLLLLVRAGEAALLVAEELALEQVLRHRGAVLADEELVAPARAVVHGGGDELLADAGLPLDEHRHLVSTTLSSCSMSAASPPLCR
jgi:hypothetical protein